MAMKNLSKQLSEPHERLKEIAARLDPLLNPHGFTFYVERNSVSSGGPYENGFYTRPPIQIGLIVRGNQLGLPNYFWGKYITGHDNLIERLRRASDSVLRFDSAFDKWELVTRDGRDVVDAFVADLENIILPTIINAPELFQHAVVDAHEARPAKYGLRVDAT